jgi:predicted alpha/beta hydrolase
MELRATAHAADGRELAITRFPADGQPWATMVFAGAMGVRQDFYAPFARFLAKNGVHVVTFDYRGMGWSRPEDLASLRADVSDWAEKDLNAMLGEARAMAPQLPLTFMGHSLGGQLLGVLPDNARVSAALTVTAGSGWYRFNDRMPVRVRIFWFLAVPLLTPLFGYFPGKATRMVGDLPAGVAWQWRRWCLDPEYLLVEGKGARAAFQRVSAPILAYSFEDDPIITRTAIDSLHGFYANARVERRHLAPAEVGERRVGHFGFFAAKSEPTLWSHSLGWLRAAAQAS